MRLRHLFCLIDIYNSRNFKDVPGIVFPGEINSPENISGMNYC
jgi:hypothetical protein